MKTKHALEQAAAACRRFLDLAEQAKTYPEGTPMAHILMNGGNADALRDQSRNVVDAMRKFQSDQARI